MKTNPGRRAVLVAAVSALAAGLPAGAAQPRGGAQQERVVYHINDTEGQAMRAMQYIANHLEVNPAAKIVVVTHAAGVDFLMKGAKSPRGGAYLDVVEPLLLQGVTFMVCEITLRERQLTRDRFLSDVKFVRSGVAEIARLQSQEGYAYLKP